MLGASATALLAAAGLAATVKVPVAPIILGALGVLGLLSALLLQRLELAAERAEQLRKALPRGIKRVSELGRDEVGVAPEAPEALAVLYRPSGDDYVPRDVDDRLDAELLRASPGAKTGLVVLEGPSKAGKTRTMFEAMRRQLPDADWIAPADADAIDWLMGADEMPRLRGSTAVLWLDDLELYVRAGARGMGPEVLERLAADDRRWIVCATAGGKGILQAGDPQGYSVPMEDLMRHATAVRIPAEMSAAERERLRAYTSEAERISEDGIGEFMVAGRELIRKLESGSHRYGDPPCPQGQAVARAAINWQRAGILDPIPRATLRETYADYLPDNLDPSDEGFEEGLEWARRPLYSTAALLSGRDEFRPYDFLVTAVPEAPEPDESAWLHLLETADPAQAFDLAALAFARALEESESGWAELSERANRKALESDEPALRAYAFSNLGILLSRRGDSAGAIAAYERAVELGLVDAEVNLGHLWLEMGKERAAREAFERADRDGSAAGAFRLGSLLLDQGDDDLTDAEAALRRAEERGHPAAALRLGLVHEERGELDAAEAAYRRADAAGVELGADGLAVFLETRRGKSAEALEAWERADERGSGVGSHYVGMHLLEVGDRAAAKQALQRGGERGDDDSAHNLATLHYEDGELEQAEKWFAIADELGHPKSAYNHGVLLAQNGDLTEAEAAFLRAAERGHPKGAAAARSTRSGDFGPPNG